VIAAETVERKKTSRPQGGALFGNRPIQKAALRLAPHQHVMSTYVANVAGPRLSLHFAGAPVLEVFPVVPLMGNVSVGVGRSRTRQFNMMAVADRDLCPDLEIFVEFHAALMGTPTNSAVVGFSMVNSFGFGATRPGTATDLPLWAARPPTDCRKRVPKSRRWSALRERHLGEPLSPHRARDCRHRHRPTAGSSGAPNGHSRTRDGDGPRRTGTRDLCC
jgi:hypothetical protein